MELNWENFKADNWKADYKGNTYYIIKIENFNILRPYKIFKYKIGEIRDEKSWDAIIKQPAWFANFENVEHAQKFTEQRLGIKQPLVLFDALISIQKRMDKLINSTPTGDERNDMTEENILLLSFIEELKLEIKK